MSRARFGFVLVVALAFAGSPAWAGDCKGCSEVAKKGEGFHCGHGKIFGVELTSEKLYRALVGMKVEVEKMKCEGCKTAAKTGGTCKHCNVGLAQGKAYHSLIAHRVASGKPITAEHAAKCGGCKIAFKSNGRCSACDVGFVAGRMFSDKEVYTRAVSAYKTIVKAIGKAAKCEACAVAMVTDGKCPTCKVSFKDGKKEG